MRPLRASSLCFARDSVFSWRLVRAVVLAFVRQPSRSCWRALAAAGVLDLSFLLQSLT